MTNSAGCGPSTTPGCAAARSRTRRRPVWNGPARSYGRPCPELGWNGVLWSDLDEGTADAEIAAQVAYFDALGTSEFEWKLYDYDR